VIDRPMAGAERFGVLERALQEGLGGPGGPER
jgi:hypothetical protein